MGASVMIQLLRALDALPGDLSLVLGTHTRHLTNDCNPAPGGPLASMGT